MTTHEMTAATVAGEKKSKYGAFGLPVSSGGSSMKMGTLTLDRILGPPPEPEFKDCTRCGIRMRGRREFDQCVDCNVLNRFTTPVPFAGNGGNYAEVDPAYEIALHYAARPTGCPTMATINALKLPFVAYYASRDPIEFAYVRNLEPSDFEPKWPIVVITAHGKYVDHWSGYNLQALNKIPAAREAAIHSTEDFVIRVPIREQVAA